MMMIQRHYDDEALIALIESNRASSDAHLPSCNDCSAKAESFQMIADSLHDADVWDNREIRTEAVPSTVATLRAFADRMAADDTAAAAILEELLAGTREEWMPRLRQHPEWRTAGLVRKLLVRAYDSVMMMPPDAVEMTRMATDVADGLPVDSTRTVYQTRAAAWRDHAYSLYYTGRFPDAAQAIRTAEGHLAHCTIDDYERARLGIVRALVDRAFERFDEAVAAAVSSTAAFTRFGDAHRQASARLAHVHLLFSRADYVAADRILRELDVQLRDSDQFDTHARVLGNLGFCAWKLKNLEEAIRFYEMSSAMHASIGVVTEQVRHQWAMALMLAEAGRLQDAHTRLRKLLPEMERLGMTSEAALNALDMSELLLAQERYEEVEDLCRAAISMFERAGVAYTRRALTALGFIHEAVQQRTASTKLVRHVREYIRRLPAQPTLLFAPSFD